MLKSYKDTFCLVFAIALCICASMLFLISEDSLPVFSGGAQRSINGIFNLVNDWV